MKNLAEISIVFDACNVKVAGTMYENPWISLVAERESFIGREKSPKIFMGE